MGDGDCGSNPDLQGDALLGSCPEPAHAEGEVLLKALMFTHSSDNPPT